VALSPETAFLPRQALQPKYIGWVDLVAKPVAKKNWATSILSPDIAKAQILKKTLPVSRCKAQQMHALMLVCRFGAPAG
jgi:hypothetical protein